MFGTEGKRVYLDWAATTPLCVEAADAMAPYQIGGIENIQCNANANSLHGEGRKAFAAMEDARHRLGACLNARPDEIVFTGGATESDNMAVFGLAQTAVEERGRGDKDFTGHVITSSIEHDAVLKPMQKLKAQGMELTTLEPNHGGFIDPDDLAAAMRPNTVLVSIMMANNEIGSIQDIRTLARIAHEGGALFHTDAVQAFGKVAVDCKALGVDAASVSAHKICGPKGIGALFIRKGVHMAPFQLGGGQETGLRSGTQNVGGMVGFAAAANACCGSAAAMEEESARQRAFRDKLYRELTANAGVHASVPCEAGSTGYLPNIVNVCVEDLESETLILRMDMRGFAVAGGSACSSKVPGQRRVLSAIGIDPDLASGSLRVSLGRYTTAEDVDSFIRAFEESIEQ